MTPPPVFSIILPVYNEEILLVTQTARLDVAARNYLKDHEIIIVENGSSDDTYAQALAIAELHPSIRVIRLRHPSYGNAIRKGIQAARGRYILQVDIDFIDEAFIRTGARMIGSTDIVVGSKILKESRDDRHFMRVLVTLFTNFLIRVLFHYPGTDTHGIKIFRTDKIRPLLSSIKTKYHFFDTELLLLAARHRLAIREIPVSLATLRPSRFPMPIRIRQVLSEFGSLISRRKELSQ